MNHFEVSCKVKKVKEITEQTDVDALKESSFCIDYVEVGNINTRWFETVQIENNNIKFNIDTGSDVNVSPLSIYNKIKKAKTKLEHTNIILESW